MMITKLIQVSHQQLSRSGIFTLYATDISSFNRLLNEFSNILIANGELSASLYVPRSIQRIKDTEKVAFVKRVDLEIPEKRINDALKEVGLDVENVVRLTSKDGNHSTRTIKIIFKDVQNRNTFVHIGLQVDSMHFTAEPAIQNIKPVQCYICLKNNQVAKYCKTKQQICARCGGNHRIEQCTDSQQTTKCCNCQGDHLATSNDCPRFKEQKTKVKKLVNQYSSTTKPTTTNVPALQCLNEFPLLASSQQGQQDYIHNGMIDEIINLLTSKMEKIIEETTNKLFKTLHQKIKKIEKFMSTFENIMNEDIDDSNSDEEIQVYKDKKKEQQQKQHIEKTTKPTTTSIITSSKASNASNETTTKAPQKPKATAKTVKTR
ncbi:unnamed protein product [Rotaria sp. Silwood2]|nr:unnamed protein product [Rotaria sp. Silwood2]CAF4155782.1 unnamed protein product [Rotaria sp. Silwood2]